MYLHNNYNWCKDSILKRVAKYFYSSRLKDLFCVGKSSPYTGCLIATFEPRFTGQTIGTTQIVGHLLDEFEKNP